MVWKISLDPDGVTDIQSVTGKIVTLFSFSSLKTGISGGPHAFFPENLCTYILKIYTPVAREYCMDNHPLQLWNYCFFTLLLVAVGLNRNEEMMQGFYVFFGKHIGKRSHAIIAELSFQ